MPTQSKSRRNRHAWLVVIPLACLITIVLLSPIGIATAQSDPPPLPAGYYGEITINGDPADIGTTVEAEINGEVRGSIVVAETGQYGSSEAGGERLSVTGSNSESGDTSVTFYVDGEGFDRTKVGTTTPETVVWQSGDIKQVNLSASVDFDPSDDENSDEGSSGGGGGGGGQDGTSGSPEETGSSTIQDVKDTLKLVEPGSSTETPIEQGESDTAGSSVEVEESDSINKITFDRGDASGSVQVTDYGDPPEAVKEEIAESVSNDIESSSTNSEADSTDDSSSDGGESDSGGGTSTGSNTVNVLSVADIQPTEESTQDSSATVELTVAREKVSDPDQLSVMKEGYVFEAQEVQWIKTDTSVKEVTDEAVTIESRVDSFSLFAVVETQNSGLENTSDMDDTESKDPDSQTSTDDGIPGFGFTSFIIASLMTILCLVVFIRTD